MRFLVLSSFIFFLSGCAPLYKDLQAANTDAACLYKFVPAFSSTLYKADVNIIGKNLSGLLLIKKMPDSSVRFLFSNEPGLTFFDMGFAKDGTFKVYKILKKMNKKAVIKTLRKDFEMILMQQMNMIRLQSLKDSQFAYFTFSSGKDHYYYITDLYCTHLQFIERATKRKKLVQVTMQNYKNDIPDSIGITHKNFNFSIGLKYLER